MSDICVVHLVRKKNGMEPFRFFLESYLKYPAGIDHDLLILYKGFYRKADTAPYEKLLKDIPHTFLRVADFGFDLRPYFVAAKKHDSKYFCFLNSFSVILDKDWLRKLYRQIKQPGVGLVGATGSWGSLRPGQVKKKTSALKQMARFLFVTWPGKYLCKYFDPFPNYHIRTNGFMIARDHMLQIHHGIILTKMQVWILESGRNGITKQIERMGLKPMVVGKDGRAHKKEDWWESNTFWRGKQENLLISDNQTRAYAGGEQNIKITFSYSAWGQNASPDLTK